MNQGMSQPASPRYIDNQADLLAWVEHLARADVIAVDTESDSLHRYREKVCLIQMTALGQDALIDPLAVDDLSCLGEMFADPRRVKIFHDACYDLVSLSRDFGYRFAGLFDTMLASRILGQREFGLAVILKQRFGFGADKRLQRSDWAARPLSAEQVSYARYDTHFLPQLYVQLTSELHERGRLDWAREEFARLPDIASRVTPRSAGVDPNGFWRVRGVKALSPAAKGRVRALWLMRERLAERLDRPPFKVLGDQVLLDLAEAPPDSLDTFEPRPGLRRAGVDRFGAEIMRALHDAKPVNGGPPPGSGRRRRSGRFLDPDVRDRFEALRAMRREKAEALGIDPEVALGNAVLEEFARHPPQTVAEVTARPELQGWRLPIFAEAIFWVLSQPPPPAVESSQR
jgi:ribonuclease D